jgi:hypothetical protein
MDPVKGGGKFIPPDLSIEKSETKSTPDEKIPKPAAQAPEQAKLSREGIASMKGEKKLQSGQIRTKLEDSLSHQKHPIQPKPESQQRPPVEQEISQSKSTAPMTSLPTDQSVSQSQSTPPRIWDAPDQGVSQSQSTPPRIWDKPTQGISQSQSVPMPHGGQPEEAVDQSKTVQLNTGAPEQRSGQPLTVGQPEEAIDQAKTFWAGVGATPEQRITQVQKDQADRSIIVATPEQRITQAATTPVGLPGSAEMEAQQQLADVLSRLTLDAGSFSINDDGHLVIKDTKIVEAFRNILGK